MLPLCGGIKRIWKNKYIDFCVLLPGAKFFWFQVNMMVGNSNINIVPSTYKQKKNGPQFSYDYNFLKKLQLS
jgi:hypothetical protein